MAKGKMTLPAISSNLLRELFKNHSSPQKCQKIRFFERMGMEVNTI